MKPISLISIVALLSISVITGCSQPVSQMQGQGMMQGQGAMQGQGMMQGQGAMQGQDSNTDSTNTTGQLSNGTTALPKNAMPIFLTILPGGKLGPDGKLHDTFSPANFAVKAGVPVAVTVYNYDSGSHSFTSSNLGVNQSIPGASKQGVPSVTTFTFTAKSAGTYSWFCAVPCDDAAGGWAMSHNGYMTGTVTAE